MIKINKGFTLVELIVVISILAILGTIAFISFGNFTISARDSSRISDIKNISTVIETYRLNTGIYPKPTNPVAINYSGGVVFWQGTFGKESRMQLGTKGNISTVPVDPLFDTEYSYSVQSTNKAYNISYILEGEFAHNGIISNKTYATEQREVIPIVKGNFNGQVAHTSTGGKVYIFAIPSLILSNLSDTNILNTSNKYVYNRESNIAATYSGSINSIGTFEYTPKLVYSGATLPKSSYGLKILITNTKKAINGTYLYGKPEYRELIEINVNNPNDLLKWGKRYINEGLLGRVKLTYFKTCKEIQNSDENRGSNFYTISPNGYDKIEVYCDMNTDGGGWTRIKKWDRLNGITEGRDISKTKGIYGTEVMVTYTRYGKIRKNISGTWTTIDLSGKKYGYQYKKFQTKQTQESGLCGEHTTIPDLISHITSGSWKDCSRSCQKNDPNDPNSGCDSSLEYADILLDDLGENIGINNDKILPGFDDDICIDTGHRTSVRNIAWYSDGRITHRIDNNTSIITLGGNSSRCSGISRNKSRLDNKGTTWLNERGINDTSQYLEGFDTQEVWIR